MKGAATTQERKSSLDDFRLTEASVLFPSSVPEERLGRNVEKRNCANNNGSESKPRSKQLCEYELPELVVFVREKSYHYVKDICVDKETNAQGKCLVEDCDLDHRIISCIIESDGSDQIKRAETRRETKTYGEEDEECYNDNIKKEIIVPEPLFLVGEVQKAVLTSSMVPLTVVEKNATTSHVNSATLFAPTDPEKIKIACSDNGSSISTPTGTEELLLGSDSHAGKTIPAGLEVGMVSWGALTESPSQTPQSYSEESSLFGSGHFSGLISHHGVAGPSFRSTSHRSNSSTTSSRSFAFPVLAAEWHGSPERMARIENQKLKKRKGKCVRFLCCRF